MTIDEVILNKKNNIAEWEKELAMTPNNDITHISNCKEIINSYAQELEWFEDYKNIKKWKKEILEEFCKRDASSFEEIELRSYMKALSDVEYMLNNIEINIDKDTVMDFYRKALDKLQILGELKENNYDD